MNRLLSLIAAVLLSWPVLSQNKVDTIRKTNIPSATAADSHNKVAILPFTFIKEEIPVSEEVSMQVQNECYALLSKHGGVYTIQDPRKTIVLLNKAGITKATMMNYTMDEICAILGVEYTIDGMITMSKTAETLSGASSYNNQSKETDRQNGTTKSTSGSSSGYLTQTKEYLTTLNLKVYNDKGTVLYNQNRRSLWDTVDSYKPTLTYVLKRSPLYSR